MAITHRKPLVFSLVYNSCISDARVLKQAKSLSEADYQIKIFANTETNSNNYEQRDGYELFRFDCYKPIVEIQNHYCEIKNIFDSDAELISILCEQHESLSKVYGSLDALDNLISPTYSPANAYTRLVRRYRTINRLKESVASYFSYHLKTTTESYRKIFRGCQQPLSDARGNVFFYANYYLYSANLANLKFDQKPDIIHAHDLYTLPAAIALKKLTGAKLVYDAHELEAERAPPLPPRKKKFIARLETRCLREVDAMITVCDSIANIYTQKNILDKPPTIVMNAPEISEQKQTDQTNDMRARSKIGKDIPLIAYTGGVSRENRGMDKVVESLALLPDFHLAIMGPSNKNNDQWLLSIAKAFDVADRIHFLPPVKHYEVVNALTSADVGIIAVQDVTLSYRYALPNKIFEMSFAGLPLCVSDLPEMKNFVTENKIGVSMDQTNPKAIAAAIDHVYKNRSKYAPGAKQLNTMIEKYKWQHQADNILELYETLLN